MFIKERRNPTNVRIPPYPLPVNVVICPTSQCLEPRI